MKEMTVADLIKALEAVPDKRQMVAMCVMGVEIGETVVIGVNPEIPDKNDPPGTIGVCWLDIPAESLVHE